MSDRLPFPQDSDEFDGDARIAFSKPAGTFILEDENGEEWEWLQGPRKWTRTVTDEEIAQQGEIYRTAGDEEPETVPNPSKKRKQTSDAPQPAKQAKVEKAPRKNAAIFVTNLPSSVNADEINAVFKKFGVIAESIDDNKPRVKLYYDDSGAFKGEALIVYFRPESVANACTLADGAHFDLAKPNPAGPMHVAPAEDTYKVHAPEKEDTASTKPDKKPRSSNDKKKAIRKAEEMNRRLADWSDDEEVATIQQTSSRWDKVVIIKHAFSIQELKDDPEFREDLEADMEDEAKRHGEVHKITIFDKEDNGVVSIRFRNAMAARACVGAFNGRNYNHRQLEAYIADGSERFKMMDDSERLEAFTKYIERDEGPAAQAPANGS